MSNTYCYAEAGNVDIKYEGKISQQLKTSYPFFYIEQLARLLEDPSKLNINPTSFGISGF